MTPRRILVIGSGPAGSSVARIFADAGFKVDIFDGRDHIAGNCYDKINEHGHLIHCYGPHYFRTNSDELLDWLSQFTDWLPGEYYVTAQVQKKEVPLPISLATLEALKNLTFNQEMLENYLQKQRVISSSILNAEEQCLNLVGKELYELLFKNYTIKQWGVHPKELDPSVTARIPLRFNHDTRYPSEKHQVLPQKGYTEMFRKILNHPNIYLQLKNHLSSEEIKRKRKYYQAVFYTGAIDTFFNYTFGKLKYRSLHFKWVHHPHIDLYLKNVQLNFPNEQEYTSIVETKHITKISGNGTTLCYEYPSSSGEPFYPMPVKSQQERYHYYAKLAQEESSKENPIFFLGRLAEYKYYNMDHIFLRAISLAREVLSRIS